MVSKYCFLIYISILSIISLSQASVTEKNETEITLQKLDETKAKINSLTPSDFTTYLTEVNQIRNKIDELTDNITRLCGQIADIIQSNSCIEDAKLKIKDLWAAYFKSREEYLNKLHDFFIQENTKQAKSTEQTIENLTPTKSRDKGHL